MQGKLSGLLLVAMLAGCTVASDLPAAENRAAVNEDPVVNIEFRVAGGSDGGNAFTAGETARFVFSVINRGDTFTRIAYTFPPHRVSVMPAGGGEAVWQAHHGRMFPQVMRHDSIAPGETLGFEAEWDLRDAASGERVPAGEYIVRAEFNAFAADGEKLPSRLPVQGLTVKE